MTSKLARLPAFNPSRVFTTFVRGSRAILIQEKSFFWLYGSKTLTVAEYSEMTVFSDIRRMGNLDAFRLRPEVAVRTAIIPRKR